MVIRSAIIGAGKVAQQHMACVSSLSGVSLEAVCDLSRVLAESAADRYSAKKWFTDHKRMLEEVRPDIVHITTPPAAHFRLAKDCLEAGCHVFLEKPATVTFDELVTLQDIARSSGRRLVENYNYLFNEPVRRLRDNMAQGLLGDIVHVDVQMCLNILDPDYPAMDRNARNPVLDLKGGVIADFIPHLASLAHCFCGAAESVRSVWLKRTAASHLPYDEMRALVRGNRATAALLFSAHGQPDVFRISVIGTSARAVGDIFEHRYTRSALRAVPKPLIPLFNALDEAKVTRRSAWGLLWRKLSGGPGAYDGLWLHIRLTYDAVRNGTEPPVGASHIHEVNRMADEIKREENRL